MNLSAKRASACLIALLLWLVVGAMVADSAFAKSTKRVIAAASPTQQPGQLDISIERMEDGRDFLNAMTDAANSLKNYSFDYETDVYKGSKVIDQQGKFYFKQPRQIRVQMTGAYKRGAEAVLMKDGRARGHLGGALASFVVTLQPNSDMLLGANGYPLIDSDFLSMAKVCQTFVKQGIACRVSTDPISVDGQPTKVYVIEFRKTGNELYKRAYIDPQSMLPLEWFDYDDGRLFARTVWRNLKMNLDLKDDFFKL